MRIHLSLFLALIAISHSASAGAPGSDSHYVGELKKMNDRELRFEVNRRAVSANVACGIAGIRLGGSAVIESIPMVNAMQVLVDGATGSENPLSRSNSVLLPLSNAFVGAGVSSLAVHRYPSLDRKISGVRYGSAAKTVKDPIAPAAYYRTNSKKKELVDDPESSCGKATQKYKLASLVERSRKSHEQPASRKVAGEVRKGVTESSADDCGLDRSCSSADATKALVRTAGKL